MTAVRNANNFNPHLRAEIARQWQHLTVADIDECGANPAHLIELLQTRYGFARRRAEQEVHLFLAEFQERLRMAA